MTLTTKLGVRTASFALMTRIFSALRRTGRLVDMIWFQENAEYACAVLDLADKLDDPQLGDAVPRLRQHLRGFLDGSVASVVIAPETLPESAELRVPRPTGQRSAASF